MKLTENFSKSEFDSKDGSVMPGDVLMNVQKVANQLQVLRNHINKPIKINSGYRSPDHNRAIGGVSNSQHVLGKAADITVTGVTTSELSATIEQLISDGHMLQGGLGVYNTFIHYDIRKNRVRWNKQT